MALERICSQCDSARVRRGGVKTWTVYVVLLVLAVPAFLFLHLNGALVAGVMIAVILLAHLTFNEWVCLSCGHQWRG